MPLVALYFKYKISPKGSSSITELLVPSARKGKSMLWRRLDRPGVLGNGTLEREVRELSAF